MKIVTFTLTSLFLLGGIATLAVVQSGQTSEAQEPTRVTSKDVQATNLKKLAGEWKVVDWRFRGDRKFTRGIGRRYVFAGDKLTVHNGRRKTDFRIAIDPAKKQKRLDIRGVEFPITRPAIYKFADGKLIICQGALHTNVNVTPGGPTKIKTDTNRPEGFAAREDWNLVTLVRLP